MNFSDLKSPVLECLVGYVTKGHVQLTLLPPQPARRPPQVATLATELATEMTRLHICQAFSSYGIFMRSSTRDGAALEDYIPPSPRLALPLSSAEEVDKQ